MCLSAIFQFFESNALFGDKNGNIKYTNCPISTHLAKKVTLACYVCICFFRSECNKDIACAFFFKDLWLGPTITHLPEWRHIRKLEAIFPKKWTKAGFKINVQCLGNVHIFSFLMQHRSWVYLEFQSEVLLPLLNSMQSYHITFERHWWYNDNVASKQSRKIILLDVNFISFILV